MVRTFQFTGRRAASDMRVMRSTSSSVKPFMQPSATHSRVVPGYSAQTPQRATTSSTAAVRDGTGLPSPSLWVKDLLVEKPRPPASRDCARIRCIWTSSAAVASRLTASSFMTMRRRALWPTMPATFTPSFPSNRPRKSPKLRQFQSTPSARAAGDIPSTLTSMAARYAASESSPSGAMLKPQLPMTTLVMPCWHDGVA